MPANFPEINYDILNTRKTRVVSFFNDLENKLSSVGAPSTAHQDIYFDGSTILRISDNATISSLPSLEILKYYPQGLGLMKLAMNNQLYA
jgi:hypothetical protein